MAVERCVYELDRHYRITAVDAGWCVFAEQNGASHLLPPGILGDSVMDHISDSTTANLYGQLFDRVRFTGETVVVPIRCDGPAARRFLDLEIHPRPEYGLRLVSHTVRIEPRPPVRLLDAGALRSEDWLRVCSWCKNVLVDGEWVPTEEAVTRMRLFERDAVPQITHSICPLCQLSVEKLAVNARRTI